MFCFELLLRAGGKLRSLVAVISWEAENKEQLTSLSFSCWTSRTQPPTQSWLLAQLQYASLVFPCSYSRPCPKTSRGEGSCKLSEKLKPDCDHTVLVTHLLPEASTSQWQYYPSPMQLGLRLPQSFPKQSNILCRDTYITGKSKKKYKRMIKTRQDDG